jgi:CubicO group peptidase (beta-lactamase class C family)
MVIERVSGQPLETFLRERIFDPLQLRMVADPDQQMIPGEARSYSQPGSGRRHQEGQHSRWPNAIPGASPAPDALLEGCGVPLEGPSPLRQGATAASVIVLIPAIRAVRSSLS